jgi:ankyrin repeat protein
MQVHEDFVSALKAGDASRLDALLANRPELLNDEWTAPSPVLLALYSGRPELAEWLVARGARLGLAEAVACGRTSDVAAALTADAAVAAGHSADGFPLLALAAFFGRLDVMRLLLEAGADPNARARNAMLVTPLHSAVAHRQPDVVMQMAALLLERGADPNVRQHGGWTPLHSAAKQGHVGLVQLLLLKGADLRLAADDGSTALELAEKQGHLPVVRLLEGWM